MSLESEDLSQSEVADPGEFAYKEDPEIDLGLLIEIIQSYEFIYNLSDKRYKDQKLNVRAWQEISEILKCPVEICQKAWKSVRDKFVKEKNKQKASGSCPSENVWPFYDKMLFYSKFNKPRRTFSNTKAPADPTPDSRPSSAASVWSSIDMIMSPNTDEEMPYAMSPIASSHEPSTSKTTSQDPSTSVATPKKKLSRKGKKINEDSSNLGEVVTTAKKICTMLEARRTGPSSTNAKFSEYVAARLDEMKPEQAQQKRREIMLLLD